MRRHLDLVEEYHRTPRPSWVIINGDFPRSTPPPGGNGVFFGRPNEQSLRLPKWDGERLEFKFRYVRYFLRRVKSVTLSQIQVLSLFCYTNLVALSCHFCRSDIKTHAANQCTMR